MIKKVKSILSSRRREYKKEVVDDEDELLDYYLELDRFIMG